jgi:uncharacterized membrane protein
MSEDLGSTVYTLGIISIVLGFLSPLAGLIFGVIGFKLSKKSNNELSKKGKKFNKFGIIVSIIMLIITIAVTIYAYYNPGVLPA